MYCQLVLQLLTSIIIDDWYDGRRSYFDYRPF